MDTEYTLGNTVILAVVAPTPDQLREAREGILAKVLEDDRELTRSLCDCCGRRPGVRTVYTPAAYETWACDECLEAA